MPEPTRRSSNRFKTVYAPFQMRFLGLVAWLGLAMAVMLAGCGGGDINADRPGVSNVAQESAVQAQSSLPPQSYTFRLFSTPAHFPFNYRKGGVLNSRGQFVGADASGAFMYDAASDTVRRPPAADATVYAIGEDGVVAGTVSGSGGGPRAFAWFTATGTLELVPLEAWSSTALFVSATGLVGGHTCAQPPPNCIGASYHWNPSTSALVIHRDFVAAWMDNQGTMVGLYSPPGASPLIATVTTDGAVTPISPRFEWHSGLSLDGLYIADNGDIFINESLRCTLCGEDGILVSNGATRRVGHGVADPATAPGTSLIQEWAAFYGYRNSGHVVGIDHVEFLDCDVRLASEEVAFFWSPEQDAAVPVRVGSSQVIPWSVNKDGVVVGQTRPLETTAQAFIWTQEAGGRLLHEVVPGLPSGTTLLDARVVGDGGHIVVHTNRGLAFLTPIR